MSNLRASQLTAASVPTLGPGKYTDGHGLTLFVQPSGSRQWVQRIHIHGKRREFGLGGFPMVTLREAREKAFENRRIARAGGDPRRQSVNPAVPTFAEATRTVHAIHAPSWRSDKQCQQWIDEVSRIVWPAVGHLPVDAITTAQLTEVFKPIWLTKPVIANRVRQRTEKIMEWCIAEGHRPDNPANAPLKANLPKQPKGGHHRAIQYTEVAGALDAVRNSPSGEMVKCAFEFLVLTATRKAETLKAAWNEIDLEAGIWTIPASRMKAEREHRIPLSKRATEILARAKAMSPNNRSGFVFVSPRGRAYDEKTMNTMLANAGVKASPHGFRASFKSWCMETGQDHAATEFSLAHTLANQTEGSCVRTDLFDIRRALMEAWAAFLAEGA